MTPACLMRLPCVLTPLHATLACHQHVHTPVASPLMLQVNQPVYTVGVLDIMRCVEAALLSKYFTRPHVLYKSVQYLPAESAQATHPYFQDP